MWIPNFPFVAVHGPAYSYTFLLLVSWLSLGDGFRCKWSNEECTSNSECCSDRCELAHPGTNPRCTKSALYEPCIFHYQCASRLKCSRTRYECCSPYWGSCMNRTDCCNWKHLCVPAEGSIYRRCLYKEVTSTAAPDTDTSWTMTSVGVLLSQLISIFSLNTILSINGTLPLNTTPTEEVQRPRR